MEEKMFNVKDNEIENIFLRRGMLDGIVVHIGEKKELHHKSDQTKNSYGFAS